jgi:glutamine amidotransferase
MCELFGMSARYPTDVNHSLALLRPRGGEIGPHADGWGVAFYEGRAARIFKEPTPAAESRCLAFIAENDYQSSIVIGHIRKANPANIGRTAANTHPFSRELGGRSWVFAHNGKLPGIREDPRFALDRFQPIGATDSEHAFCFLLNAITETGNRDKISEKELILMLNDPVQALEQLGEFNFLMSDGVHLIAFASTKLCYVQRNCMEHDCRQRVMLLATTPLTAEVWSPLIDGTLYVFAHGELLESVTR